MSETLWRGLGIDLCESRRPLSIRSHDGSHLQAQQARSIY